MNRYFIIDGSGLSEAQVDAIDRRGFQDGYGTNQWARKIVHTDGRKAVEIAADLVGEMGTKTVNGQRIVTDAELSIIGPGLKSFDQMASDGWFTTDEHGSQNPTYA